ncbi:metallophosphoesterase family protein [Nodosilinea sp. FACHB-13]|uniref:purple acid phosphatase family protein n=1 Tax=Cyanophyceae TaxID=3028117 RepID=UPI00168412B8|nr:metallophosphoesterase family protein [Nodosilinea sp. FACHB-13]MBD2106227.1 metallophosphoesterase family protein [Nodosilinea sp. FACHB-13]
MRRKSLTLPTAGLLLVITTILLIALESRQLSAAPSPEASAVTTQLLTDPFLQNPTPGAVRVVWFTEFEGQDHQVRWGSPGQPSDVNLPNRAPATTTRLARTREDGQSRLEHPDFLDLQQTLARPIWRHEAEVTGLLPGQRVPYRVASTGPNGTVAESRTFTLAGAPAAGQPTKILLTSDHQNMPMVAANLQKVAETLGQVDAVFFAGDLVNNPDRASEWFDDSRGVGFFPCLQGNTHYDLERNGRAVTYQGGEIIQHAPLFPILGNHEVMGRFAPSAPLGEQFNQAVPRSAAVKLYEANTELFNPAGDPNLRHQWIVDNSFNSDTYEALFSLPVTEVPNRDRPETTSRYYAVTFGDIRLVSLYVTQIWRPYNLDVTARGRYQEREADLGTPQNWGHGQHIFEPIERGSLQYQWLEQELASEAFRQAKYKVVMLHHPPHTLGDNIVPAFTNPVRRYDRDSSGRLTAVRYEYPRADDYIARDLVPLLEQAEIDLVFYGHSHLWNRFVSPQGTHYLETSNVGNSYGAFWKDKFRPVPPETIEGSVVTYSSNDYVAQGDPNGLEPVVPTIAPLRDDSGNPLPYLTSNDITAFSVFDTGTGTISSYYFDTREPDSAVVKFDEFVVGR